MNNQINKNIMKILISGASRGIGRFLMDKFIEDGHEVFGTYFNTLPDKKYEKHLSQANVSDYEKVITWVNEKVNNDDKLVVLNCAGLNYNSFAHNADFKKWKKVIDVNLIGTFNLINATLPYMREKKFGRIINFSSVVAQKGVPGTSAYAASKSALWGMSKSIAQENAKKGITINNLNLGYFDIGMISRVPDPILDVIKETIPSKNLGNPDAIYSAINFLIENDYLNGSSLDINGGLF
jgi:NAD(P)-dependent dehydrogenase (short-subunit alcohol dehydrogenase family)